MQVVILTVICGLFYTMFEVFAALAGGSINQWLAAVLYNGIGTAVPLLIYFGTTKGKTTTRGIVYASLAGVAIMIVSLLLARIFNNKGSLGFVIPTVYGIAIVLSGVYGWVFLKEKLTGFELLGFILVAAGIICIVAAKAYSTNHATATSSTEQATNLQTAFTSNQIAALAMALDSPNGASIANASSPASVQEQSGNTSSDTPTVSGPNDNGAQNVTKVDLADRSSPLITYHIFPAPNSNGWNNTQVRVTFTASDDIEGILSCTTPQTITTEGADQKVTGVAVNKVGDIAEVTADLNIDGTPPIIGLTAGTTNTIAQGQAVQLIVPAFDSLSGVVGGEYYPGSAAPEPGKGRSMEWDGKNLRAQLGAELPVGTYEINVRAKDAAGNWSTPVPVNLVIAATASSQAVPTNPQLPQLAPLPPSMDQV